MSEIKSALSLQTMVFDKIEFSRKGFKNENDIEYEIQVQIGRNQEGEFKVTLILSGEKKEEYEFTISISGFFEIDTEKDLGNVKVQDLINKNAVAILMPYLRSELTLLTAQPNTESIVLPPFNINKMLDRESEK